MGNPKEDNYLGAINTAQHLKKVRGLSIGRILEWREEIWVGPGGRWEFIGEEEQMSCCVVL